MTIQEARHMWAVEVHRLHAEERRPIGFEAIVASYRRALSNLRGRIPGRHAMRIADSIEGYNYDDRKRKADPRPCPCCGGPVDRDYMGMAIRPALTGNEALLESGQDVLCWSCAVWAAGHDSFDQAEVEKSVEARRSLEAGQGGMGEMACMPVEGPAAYSPVVDEWEQIRRRAVASLAPERERRLFSPESAP